MIEQQQPRPSRKIIIYRIAKWALTITAWIWTTIIIAFLAQYVPILLTTPITAKNNNDLAHTWTATTFIPLLQTPKGPVQEVLKLIILIITVLLIIIPPLAFVLKQTLQSVQLEGFDKLIKVLQEDTISPKLDDLEKHLKQQMQKQDACIETLGHIHDVLQKTPTASDLQELYTLSQQQQQPLQKEFSHTLQDLQNRVSEQPGWLGDFYQQEQNTQETISRGLQNVASLLEQIRDGSKTNSLQDYPEHTPFPNQQKATDEVPAIIPSAQTNHQERSACE